MNILKRVVLSSILMVISFSIFSQNMITFDLTTDEYASETSWEIRDAAESTVASEDSYTSNEFTYPTVEIDLPNGEYTFEIFDSFGDGICCSNGNGVFVLTDVSTEDVIATGGDYGTGMSVSFVLPYIAPIYGCTDSSAYNYNADAEEDDGSCVYTENPFVLSLTEVVDGFADPVDLTHAGDDRMFVVEQDGYIKIINSDFTVEAVDFLNIDANVTSGGERGLLGLAFHPDYGTNGYFFVNYTKNGGDSRISRFTVSADPNVADPESEVIILEQEQPYSNHNAGDLAFGADGYLYIPFGDGGSGEDPENYGQSNDTWLGKMLRIDVDGGDEYAIPADNPFVGNDEYLPEIWATGLRNTWRFSFDAETGDMWMGDVGQYVWEEIDFEPAGDAGGRNYGWRCYEGNHEFNTFNCVDESELTWPVAEYNHSGGACSVTGGFIYRGTEYPSMYGRYFYTDYCNGVFRSLQDVDGEFEEEIVTSAQGFGWTSFGDNSSNDLFVCKDNGNIYKLGDACGDYEATLSISDGVLTASEGDEYVWFLNNEIIEGANDQTFVIEIDGIFAVAVYNADGCVALSQEVITSVHEHDLSTYFTIYPNPVQDVLGFNTALNIENEVLIVYDQSGREVKREVLNSNSDFISLKGFSNGNYYLQIITDKGIVRKTFVVID